MRCCLDYAALFKTLCLVEAIDQLRHEGHTYLDLQLDEDAVVARVLKIKPELARKGNASMAVKNYRYF